MGAAPPGLDAVHAGDDAWQHGARRDAREHWLRAAASTHPAVGMMAEARLLQVSGTAGLLTHGPRLDEHRTRCPEAQSWCALAAVDVAVFLPRVGLGDAGLDVQSRWSAMEARLDPDPDPDLRAAVDRRRVWLGDEAEQPRPPSSGPGTWTLGLAPFGATGLGVGGAVVFAHPDVGLRGGRLHASVGATAAGSVRGQLAYDSPGSVWWHGQTQVARYRSVALSGAAATSRWSWRTVTVGAGPGLRRASSSVWLGPALLLDDAPGASVTRAVGAMMGGRTQHARWASSVDVRGVTGDYTLATGTAHVVMRSRSERLVGRLSVAPTHASSDCPLWRMPGWGGGVVLRHGGWQSLRNPVLSGAVAELRTRPIGRVQAAMFSEAAWGGQWVVGGGAGVSVRLPPNPQSALRVDVAWGSLGLGVSTGWGRYF
ncbi:MAG: hypothetical protein CL927_01265 [Deltaproteobacteria bacterium]|nr:hypothetical protein [Deltaproteobacteria bacterium]